MKKYILIPLFLLCFNAYAGLEALSIPATANGIFNISCFDNETWETGCSNTSDWSNAEYEYLFHAKGTQASIAIGYVENNDSTSFVSACRKDPKASWKDCTPPDFAVGSYNGHLRPAHNGEGALMIVGRGDKGSLIAACRNEVGHWHNCSPMNNTDDFYVAGVSYTDNQWIVLSGYGRSEWSNGIATKPALCMDLQGVWSNCDIKAQDPNMDFFMNVNLNAVQFVESSQEWVAVGMGYDDIHQDIFKSICRKDHEATWHDCTNGIFLSNTDSHIVQNNQGELLQVNHFLSGAALMPQALCKRPHARWEDCSKGLMQNNQMYAGIALDSAGHWILVGTQLSSAWQPNGLLTAKWDINNNDWEVIGQIPDETQYGLIDVIFIE